MRNRKGFTLVELSIVLVVIGLLIGGVLKGKSMIDNAKQKRVKGDVDGIVAATYNYQDKYGFLPGDDTTNLATGTLAVAGCTGGNGDGSIGTTAERICAWRAIIAAGFVSGDKTKTTEATVAKTSPYGGQYVFRSGNNIGGSGMSGNYIQVLNVPLEVIEDLDRKYDDGIYNTGEITSTVAYTATSTAASDLNWIAF
ncbi:MAG: prepilin-type N-terminal cleavage/methylation domain-containing protein [Sulfurovum sp.]|nr:prepilin-type N-terminal cleavage/methylation domain-containing protein [Sulfurovum sp.]